MVAARAGEAGSATASSRSATAIPGHPCAISTAHAGGHQCTGRATDTDLWWLFHYAYVAAHWKESCGLRRAVPCDLPTGHRLVTIEIKRGESSTHRGLEGRAL